METWKLKHMLRYFDGITERMEKEDNIFSLMEALFGLGEILNSVCHEDYGDETSRWIKSTFEMRTKVEKMIVRLTV